MSRRSQCAGVPGSRATWPKARGGGEGSAVSAERWAASCGSRGDFLRSGATCGRGCGAVATPAHAWWGPRGVCGSQNLPCQHGCTARASPHVPRREAGSEARAVRGSRCVAGMRSGKAGASQRRKAVRVRRRWLEGAPFQWPAEGDGTPGRAGGSGRRGAAGRAGGGMGAGPRVRGGWRLACGGGVAARTGAGPPAVSGGVPVAQAERQARATAVPVRMRRFMDEPPALGVPVKCRASEKGITSA
jgi:hypothetical protein